MKRQELDDKLDLADAAFNEGKLTLDQAREMHQLTWDEFFRQEEENGGPLEIFSVDALAVVSLADGGVIRVSIFDMLVYGNTPDIVYVKNFLANRFFQNPKNVVVDHIIVHDRSALADSNQKGDHHD